MIRCRSLFGILGSALCLAAAPAPAIPAPPLAPGEALALAGPDGTPYLFGDCQRESPMGSLASLVWLRLEGADWSSAVLSFKCTGVFNGQACSTAKGHGRVDLAGALQKGCDLAILTWGQSSALGWRKEYGDGAARARLEDAFRPFLGQRMPPGEELPALDGRWVGDGALLRVSPQGMLTWLIDPGQDELLRRARRNLLSFLAEQIHTGNWWVFPATAPVPTQIGVTSGWAVGSNGTLVAVLRLPPGSGRDQALARFKAILMPKGK